MRLVITRPEPEAQALAEKLRQLSHEPVLQPLLEFRSLPFDPTPIIEAQALIVTSGNALRALEERLDIGHVAGKPLYCVGHHTASRTASLGFCAIKAVAPTAEELADEIIDRVPQGAAFVYLAGQHRAFDFEARLGSNGFAVTTAPVYAMEARRAFDEDLIDLLARRAVDGVLLMSARTAQVFLDLCRKHGILEVAKEIRYFCLSRQVAQELEIVQPLDVRIASAPELSALLTLVEKGG